MARNGAMARDGAMANDEGRAARMTDPTNAEQPAVSAPVGEPLAAGEQPPAGEAEAAAPPLPGGYAYPAYPLMTRPPWGLDAPAPPPVYIVEADRRPRRWMAPAAAVLITIVVIFGALDLLHLVFPQPGTGATSLIIQVNQPGSTSLADAVLKLTPTALTVSCRASAVLTLSNSGTRPLTWSVDAIPDGILIDQRSPHGGTLAQGQRISLTVLSLGQSGSGALRISDDLGETLDLPISIRCP